MNTIAYYAERLAEQSQKVIYGLGIFLFVHHIAHGVSRSCDGDSRNYRGILFRYLLAHPFGYEIVGKSVDDEYGYFAFRDRIDCRDVRKIEMPEDLRSQYGEYYGPARDVHIARDSLYDLAR